MVFPANRAARPGEPLEISLPSFDFLAVAFCPPFCPPPFLVKNYLAQVLSAAIIDSQLAPAKAAVQKKCASSKHFRFSSPPIYRKIFPNSPARLAVNHALILNSLEIKISLL